MNRKLVVTCMLGGAMGLFISLVGFPVTTAQWWVLMSLFWVYGIVNSIMESK